MLNLVSAERYRRGCYEFKRPRSGRHNPLSDINMQGMGVILTAAQGPSDQPA